MIEKSLGVLAGADADTRVELVQLASPGHTPTLELRMQVHNDTLGWTTQRRIALAAGQIPDLHAALNMMDPDARAARATPASRMTQQGLRLIV